MGVGVNTKQELAACSWQAEAVVDLPAKIPPYPRQESKLTNSLYKETPFL